MAVPRRSHCGLAQLAVHCGSFEHVQNFRRVTAKVRGFDSFPRSYGDQCTCYVHTKHILILNISTTTTNDGTTAEPWRSWRCHCVLCRTRTAVAPRLRCDGGGRSAVLTRFRGSTAINDGTTAEPWRSLRCHCGLSRTSTAVAPRLLCDGGMSN